ncbi:sigma-54-dependent Fis family transcriptional regulator [Vibrio alginolyticus]|jgi:DNA-binding NtrC family response regulator|uniref:Sigma-54-dependent Fis family transcriptional regulator n=3 Tax=Vibrio harveyi group TaxID=717610 RepID=A0A0T7EY13_9VIBR|nr:MULTISPECIES: sigma-54 dependent transcriptional regulator [Vibrio]KOY47456.1 Fis family transcriptional regulator [Vibrio parahaemolyticus]MEA3480451.1 sigma-54 dependent transcriptional regulator [Pseudomonadota bacterium]AVF60052.1 sigma-54-dependent Fis family transcriptional regulator [Vibrio diabolicus]AVF95225.1 sigma-54-dependent Fis family transcriptional regulator [Vibrio diabolicus]AVH26115.1 sigma-54-dependent Fis family transcriptional regulator [Vibrio diabolicus]
MSTQSHISTNQQYNAFSVLVVDDELGMQAILKKALGKLFSHVDTAGSIEEAEQLRNSRHYDLILLDINLPGRSGIEWEEAFEDDDKRADVIFMTGYADLEIAIRALQLGASDFILKPFNLEQMLKAVSRCMDRRLNERMQYAMKRDYQRHNTSEIIGGSEKTRQLKQLINQFAPSRASVLVEGESGTGKELVARGIHQASGRTGPFVPINCGAIAPELLESELFGHTSGAFTGAKKSREGLFRVANGGTLFLDEIGEMPLAMQASLLRVLEQRTIRPVGSEKEISIDVRIVAATNRNLQEEVNQGNFRSDLYYRLNVLKIEVCPLRERKTDLFELVPFFSNMLTRELGMPAPKWAHEDMEAMSEYDWPGNIRELKNLIERCILLGKPPAHYWRELNGGHSLPNVSITVSHSAELPTFKEGREFTGEGYPNNWTLKEVEKAHIKQVVNLHEGNKSAAARDLGVARKTLERKYKEWDSEDEEYAD